MRALLLSAVHPVQPPTQRCQHNHITKPVNHKLLTGISHSVQHIPSWFVQEWQILSNSLLHITQHRFVLTYKRFLIKLMIFSLHLARGSNWMLGTKIQLVTPTEVCTNNSKFNLNQRRGFGEKTRGRIKATDELRFQFWNTVVEINTKHLSISASQPTAHKKLYAFLSHSPLNNTIYLYSLERQMFWIL
jgi:hypothetical protein